MIALALRLCWLFMQCRNGLVHSTMLVLPDCDASPTKAWMVMNRSHYTFALAFGKRPNEELYDRWADPHAMVNLAGNAAMATTKGTVRVQNTQQ